MDIDSYLLLMRPVSILADSTVLLVCIVLAARRRLTGAGVLIAIAMLTFLYYDAVWQLIEMQAHGGPKVFEKGSARPFLVLQQIVFPVGVVSFATGVIWMLFAIGRAKEERKSS
jgi:hypothetical protein